MGKKILLKAWAAARYDPPPSQWVLCRWVREGDIYPPAEKVGARYYVDANAYRVSVGPPRLTLVERLEREGR